MTMTKKRGTVCDDVRQEIKIELSDFKDQFHKNVRKELRDIRVSLTNINKLHQEI